MTLRFGSVCSGIEAASVAFAPLGWEAAWFAEIESFPCAVLAHHYPDVPNLGDMTTIARRVLTGDVPAPDSLWGGTPCQAFSVAGLRQSLADERGNLSLKFVELANAIDLVRVRSGERECIIGWENVPGVLSTKDNAFGCFLAGLAGEDDPLQPAGGKWSNAGAVFGPKRAVAWRVLDAQYFGVAQRRRRVFVVASAREGFNPAAVLFEFDGVRRDTAPSREARQVAPTIPARSTAGGGLGTDFDCDGGLIQAFGGNNQSGPIDVATARNACASASGRMDFDTETFLVQPTHTLRGEGFDASEDGTGRGTPLVPVAFPANLSATQHASAENLSPALGALNPTAVAFGVTQQPVGVFQDSEFGVAQYDSAGTLRAGRIPEHQMVIQPGKFYEEYATSLDRSSPPPAVVAPIFQGDTNGRMDGGTPQGTNGLPAGRMRGMRRCECGSASQERGLEGSSPGELAATVQELPHESTQVGGEMPSLREAAQGVGILRDALPTLEAPRGPRIQATETCVQCGGVRLSEPLNGVLREARAASQAGDSREGATHQERSGFAPMAVRRLTPVECERLQGFPDGYTDIPWTEYQRIQRAATKAGTSFEAELKKRGKVLRGPNMPECPDGPRYKALGNSWAVPVARWIGQRINQHIEDKT